ncbi:MAG: YraN family protein [Spirochaetales bacterium]
MSTKKDGDLGEDTVALWLSSQGYHIIKRNLRCPEGEVDIIVYRDACVAFVEVKAWKKFGIESLGLSIHSGKRRNIIRTARFFLRQYPEWKQFRPRFDVAFIAADNSIHHFPDAFTEAGFQ